ncbi:MAG: hypothetical protein D6719_05230 [Candidatus Dadabacteria bacterium]|nr:MAG: hypothetical protein D6719_05230 [Candidatus Dadabacteria bacterium]
MGPDQGGRRQGPENYPDKSVSNILSYIEHTLRENPELNRLIHRVLREELIATGRIVREDIERRANLIHEAQDFPSDTHQRRWNSEERARLDAATRELAAELMSYEEVQQILVRTVKEAKEESLADYLLDPQKKITGPELLRKLEEFVAPPAGTSKDSWNPEEQLSPADMEAVKVQLTRLLLTEDSKLIRIASKILDITDFLEVARNAITTDNGIGKVGGKMTGLILFHRALTVDEKIAEERLGVKLDPDPHPDFLPIEKPMACTLTAEDVFEHVIDFNKLQDFRTYKRRPLEEVKALEHDTLDTFRNIEFPPDIEKKLQALVDRIEGMGPFMVRSSSVLEDSTSAPFSGIYNSVVFINQGSREERLDQLKAAIGEVYASTYSERAIGYRKALSHLGIFDAEENMGVTIQQMVGVKVGKYFMPVFSGVGFSYDDNVTDENMTPEDGLVSLALGHGKAVVDATPENPVRDIHLSKPALRPERANDLGSIQDVSQKEVFCVDLEYGQFVKKNFYDLQKEVQFDQRFAGAISTERRGQLFEGVYEGLKVITFDGLAEDRRFAEKMKWALNRLRTVFDEEVDIEFASNGETLTFLQGRHQMTYDSSKGVTVPENITAEDKVFEISSDKMLPTVVKKDLEYFVYIDPAAYEALQQSGSRSEVQKRISEVVRAVAAVNSKVKPQSAFYLAPGRWGTNMDESRYGLPVEFTQISKAAVLGEIIDTSGGLHFATASGGAHWPSNLKAIGLRVMVLKPNAEDTDFNYDFFKNTGDNKLADFVGSELAESVGNVVRVVNVPEATGGKYLQLASSRKERRALLWLAEKGQE